MSKFDSSFLPSKLFSSIVNAFNKFGKSCGDGDISKATFIKMFILLKQDFKV
jgi:hypothetical protein